MQALYNITVAKVNTLIRPDGVKKAYVQLTKDCDALDVANKIGAWPEEAGPPRRPLLSPALSSHPHSTPSLPQASSEEAAVCMRLAARSTPIRTEHGRVGWRVNKAQEKVVVVVVGVFPPPR